MRYRPWASLVVLGALLVSISTARGSDAPEALRAQARSAGSVRVLARLAVPESASSLPGTPGGDSSRRRAIAGARQRLEQDLGDTGWEQKRAFQTIPYVALEVTPEALDRLEASGAVLAVGEDRLERPLLPVSVPLVGADQAWASGSDGSGWTVAVLDTGIDRDHPFLAGKVVSEACYSANASCPNGQTAQLGDGAGAPCTYASGACAHGTHVAGIAAGADGTLSDGVTFSGVARGANLISIQVFSRFTGSTCDGDIEDPCALTFTSDTIAGLERVYELRDTYRIAAVNMSLGGGSFFSQTACDIEDTARKAIIDNLRAAGIATIAAAGNEGSVSALSAPACISSVISVGATTNSDGVAGFSNSAPFLDLLAPGVRIVSAIPPAEYALISGTSQAAPHVAGAFAILNQRLDGASVDQVFSALRSTGIDVLDPKSGITTPRIQIFAALESFPAVGPPSGVQLTPDGRRTLISKDISGERWAITLNPDETVTGNVFRSDGGAPQFVWCERVGDDGNPDPYAVELFYECAGAGTCGSLACPAGQWTAIAEVTLPGSFFLPPASGDAPTGTALRVEPIAQDTPSGLQITPDSRHTLVSKDVGGDRWAITRNADDGTVTGNVFPTDGGEPSFVWCEPISDDGSPDPYAVLVTYSCSGADRCLTSPCTASQWSFVSEVTLPGSFFLP
jgi:subtilisin family serine protease